MHFIPSRFPNRLIFIDLNTSPPTEKMNCLSCRKLVGALWKNDEFCWECYERWSAGLAREFLGARFG
jgi:hypothetical protein